MNLRNTIQWFMVATGLFVANMHGADDSTELNVPGVQQDAFEPDVRPAQGRVDEFGMEILPMKLPSDFGQSESMVSGAQEFRVADPVSVSTDRSSLSQAGPSGAELLELDFGDFPSSQLYPLSQENLNTISAQGMPMAAGAGEHTASSSSSSSQHPVAHPDRPHAVYNFGCRWCNKKFSNQVDARACLAVHERSGKRLWLPTSTAPLSQVPSAVPQVQQRAVWHPQVPNNEQLAALQTVLAAAALRQQTDSSSSSAHFNYLSVPAPVQVQESEQHNADIDSESAGEEEVEVPLRRNPKRTKVQPKNNGSESGPAIAAAQPVQCKWCDARPADSNALKTHLIREHGGQGLVECQECRSTFADSSGLQAHVMRAKCSVIAQRKQAKALKPRLKRASDEDEECVPARARASLRSSVAQNGTAPANGQQPGDSRPVPNKRWCNDCGHTVQFWMSHLRSKTHQRNAGINSDSAGADEEEVQPGRNHKSARRRLLRKSDSEGSGDEDEEYVPEGTQNPSRSKTYKKNAGIDSDSAGEEEVEVQPRRNPVRTKALHKDNGSESDHEQEVLPVADAGNLETAEADDQRVQCPLCDARPQHNNSLKYHLITHHGGKKIVSCPMCQARFAPGFDIEAHQQSNACKRLQGRKLAKIQSAAGPAQEVSLPELLVSLETAEADDQDFPCQFCSKRYIKQSLKSHLLEKHSKEKLVKCPTCKSMCIDESDLQKHQARGRCKQLKMMKRTKRRNAPKNRDFEDEEEYEFVLTPLPAGRGSKRKPEDAVDEDGSGDVPVAKRFKKENFEQPRAPLFACIRCNKAFTNQWDARACGEQGCVPLRFPPVIAAPAPEPSPLPPLPRFPEGLKMPEPLPVPPEFMTVRENRPLPQAAGRVNPVQGTLHNAAALALAAHTQSASSSSSSHQNGGASQEIPQAHAVEPRQEAQRAVSASPNGSDSQGDEIINNTTYCYQCKKQFSEAAALVQHERSKKHKRKGLELDGKPIQLTLLINRHYEPGVHYFFCPDQACLTKFSDRAYMVAHIRAKHGGAGLHKVCSCGAGFFDEEHEKTHLQNNRRCNVAKEWRMRNCHSADDQEQALA